MRANWSHDRITFSLDARLFLQITALQRIMFITLSHFQLVPFPTHQSTLNTHFQHYALLCRKGHKAVYLLYRPDK